MDICTGYVFSTRGTHKEIVFDGKSCPLCEALNKIDELERGIVHWKKEALEMAIRLESGQVISHPSPGREGMASKRC